MKCKKYKGHQRVAPYGLRSLVNEVLLSISFLRFYLLGSTLSIFELWLEDGLRRSSLKEDSGRQD